MAERTSIEKPLPAINEYKSYWLIAVGVLIVALVLGLLLLFDAQHHVVKLLQWFDSGGPLMPLWFVAVMAVVVIFLMPGVLFTCGAGFVFGVVEGSIYVVIGTTVGASLAFLIGRYLLGERAASYIRDRSTLHLLNQELGAQGWKVVLITRLIPFFPSKLANYFFGVSSVSFRGFVFSSLLGFIPYSVHNVYLGSLVADITTMVEGELQRSQFEWFVYGVGFLVTIAAIIYFNHLARKALSKYVA